MFVIRVKHTKGGTSGDTQRVSAGIYIFPLKTNRARSVRLVIKG